MIMEKNIPIFVHHELNAKPQTGGGKKQSYVKYCIMQAKKYNDRVILFGDESNQRFADEWYDASSFSSEKWNEFLAVFENMSDYPLSWAESFFKRFYLFEQWMKEHNVEECIVLDSDILVYRNFSDGVFDGCDVALEIPENQSISEVGKHNDLRWSACAGVAYFTYTALKNFNLFSIDMYKNQKDLLRKKYNIHLQYHLAGGVCEMSLLYLWFQARKDSFQFNNLFKENNGNIGSLIINGYGSGYLKNMYDINKKSKLLKLIWKEKIPYVKKIGLDEQFRVNSLHFGGASKIFMKDICLYERYTLSGYLEWYYWQLRGRLGAIKRRMIGTKTRTI